MKLSKPEENIYLFTFKKQKDLTLTFFRMQEYYESQNENLHEKSFSVFDFLLEQMNDNGKIKYFNDWEGFNIPGNVFCEWIALNDDLTPFEKKLFDEIAIEHRISGNFYIIGCLEEDKFTLNHELAHAFYMLDEGYRENVASVLKDFSENSPKTMVKLLKSLRKAGYNEKVLWDEVNAYVATESEDYLKNHFKIKIEEIQELRDSLSILFDLRLACQN